MLGVLALPAAVHAVPITITNASFESLSLADGATSTSLPGWTRFLAVATLNPTTTQMPTEAYDGQNVARFTDGATLMQEIGPLAYGTYTLTAAIGNPLGVDQASLALSLRRGTTFLTTTSTSFTSPADGAWSLLTIVYDVTPVNANGTLFGQVINIFALSNGSGGDQALLDNVMLDLEPMEAPTAVPEPASLGLLGVGVAVLALARGRR